jgi:hypothetical protein
MIDELRRKLALLRNATEGKIDTPSEALVRQSRDER